MTEVLLFRTKSKCPLHWPLFSHLCDQIPDQRRKRRRGSCFGSRRQRRGKRSAAVANCEVVHSPSRTAESRETAGTLICISMFPSFIHSRASAHESLPPALGEMGTVLSKPPLETCFHRELRVCTSYMNLKALELTMKANIPLINT